MTLEDQNKNTYRRFYEEVLNKGNLASIDETVHPDVVSHAPFPGQKPGSEGLKEAIMRLRSSFPDLKASVQDIIAAEDKVVGRFVVTGTHLGDFMGMAPGGKTFSYEEIVIVRLEAGKIIEHWAVMDSLTMMQQLDLFS